MSRSLMSLLLVAAGLLVAPVFAGGLEAVGQDGAVPVSACASEASADALALGVESLLLQPEKELMVQTPCPDWTCTKHLQCGYECGGVMPSCNNPTGGTCAGTCVCP